jgi:hypothetical protein
MPTIKMGRIVDALYDSDGGELNIFFTVELRFLELSSE